MPSPFLVDIYAVCYDALAQMNKRDIIFNKNC